MAVVTAKEMGAALAKARAGAGVLQEQAAAALGVSRVAISNYERGMLPVDFATEKLPRLATLYGKTPDEIAALATAESRLRGVVQAFNPTEPLDRHIHVFPASVQSWYYAFMGALLSLPDAGDTTSEAIELARAQITFDALQLWAGGGLTMSEPERCLQALHWCAEATWRNVTDPSWLSKPQSQWKALPSPFPRISGAEASAPSRGRSSRTISK